MWMEQVRVRCRKAVTGACVLGLANGYAQASLRFCLWLKLTILQTSRDTQRNRREDVNIDGEPTAYEEAYEESLVPLVPEVSRPCACNCLVSQVLC